ncbi:PQQ-binding-like beta-propeller repeat protein [Microbacterium sp. G2-8]|uniref:outer membrane protein assembly factor BamB family protein n=1 Tax=Microbacterium sp. G2-8 TaxID=2842454 RepID=UPI001C8AD7FD|nr:PQQ-binding-like beta-propeller repeat protein [Microbacterium sp. G2-8]
MPARGSERYRQLHQHYADWYARWAAEQGIPLDAVQQREYADAHADHAFAREDANGTQTSSLPVLRDMPEELIDTRERLAPEVPAAPEQVHVEPAPSLRRRRPRRLLIGVGVGAAAVVAVAGAFALPVLTATDTQADLVQDITEDPTSTWTVDVPRPAHHDVWIEAAGEDALVGTSFDQASWIADQPGAAEGADIAWYDGVGRDYEAGWDAAQEYLAAYAEYEQSLISGSDPLAFVAERDYHPSQFGGAEPAAYEAGEVTTARAGAFEGWLDATNGDWHGYSLPADMSAVDDEPRLALIDGESGEERWAIDVAGVVDGYLAGDTWQAAMNGSDQVVVWTTGHAQGAAPSGTHADSVTTGLATIDVATGETLSRVSLTGAIVDVDTRGDAVLVSRTGDPRVTAYDPSDYAAGTLWEAPIAAPAHLSPIADGVVAAMGDGGDVLIDAAEGDVLDWTSGAGYVVESVLDAEQDPRANGVIAPKRGEEIVVAEHGVVRGLDPQTGDAEWSVETTDRPTIIGDELYLTGDAGVSRVADGSVVWTAAGSAGWRPVAGDAGRLLISEEQTGELRWVDVETGERTDAVAATLPELESDVAQEQGGASVRLGDEMIYAVARGGGLTALAQDEPDPVWQLSDDWALLGGHIYTIADTEDGTEVTRLG